MTSDETTDGVDPRRELWRSGSYEIVGDWFRTASIAVLDGLSLDGAVLLDVATGTGAVAIEAARRGARVTAVDLTNELVAIAAQRADDARVDVDFVVADFDEYTSRDDVAGSFDVVASSFGVIFAPDPVATAHRLVAATKPDGAVAIAAWATAGLFDTARTDAVMALMPPGPPRASMMETWATESGLAEVFGDTAAVLVDQRNESIGLDFGSVRDAVDQFERWSGPWQQLFAYFHADGTIDAARAALIDDFSQWAEPSDAGVTMRADYVVSVLRRSSQTSEAGPQ